MLAPGDRVFIHGGIYSGQMVTIKSVDHDQKKAVADVNVFGRAFQQTLSTDDLLELSDDPAEMAQSILGALEPSLRKVYMVRRTFWWATKAHEQVEPSEALLDAFESFEAELDREADDEVAESLAQVRQAVSGMDAQAMHAWWEDNHQELLRTWKTEADRIEAEFCEEALDEDELRRATDSVRSQYEHDENFTDDDIVQMGRSRHLSTYIEAGSQLRQRCENLRARNSDAGFAYDDVDAAPVDLSVALREDHTPESFTPDELRGWNAVRHFEPPDGLSVDEALEQLRGADASPVAAIRTLADADIPEATKALRKRRAELAAIEEFSSEKFVFQSDLQLALLSQNADGDWRAALRHQASRRIYTEFEFAGIVTTSTLIEPFADNPWGIEPQATIGAALDKVWAPLASRMPNFVDYLRPRCLAVAHVTHDDQSQLFYATIRPRGHYWLESLGVPFEVPDRLEIEHLNDWIGVGDFQCLSGEAPIHDRTGQAQTMELADGRSYPIPLGLRELSCAHRRLTDGMKYVGHGFTALSEYCENVDVFQSRNEGALPARFVTFGGDGAGNCDVFDFDRLDSRDDPMVADWDHETREVWKRQPFWRLVDRRACEMLAVYDW